MRGLGDWDDPDDDDWAANPDAPGDDALGAAEKAPQLVYGNVNEFFEQFLRHSYKRVLTGRGAPFWDPCWWQHEEGLMRLEALWRSWEHLRLDPATGMSVWWRDHVDHHMPALMTEAGPFGGSEAQADRGDPLPHEQPPAGLFVDERLTPSE